MKTRPHVLFVCKSLDLPETHLAAGLARRGYPVCISRSAPFAPAREKMLRDAGVELIDLEIRNRLDLGAARRLREVLARRDFDVVYAPQNKALSATLLALPRHSAAKVVGYRGTIGHLTRWDPSSWLTYFHPRLDHIVAVSDAVRDYLVDGIRLPAGKVTRIYKGHDPAWYDTPAEAAAPLPPPASPSTVTLCFTGRIRPVKGVGYLLDAMRLVPPGTDVRLMLAGELADKRVGRRLSADKDPRVVYLGYRRDVPAILAATDVFLMPSVEREGLARSVLEAMSRRVPCVVSDVGGLPELIADGESGLVVPPRDARAIARAVTRLAGDGALRKRLGEAARERVRTTFGIDSTIRRFEDLFARLAASG